VDEKHIRKRILESNIIEKEACRKSKETTGSVLETDSREIILVRN
jgi:hypothetical protein